MRIATRKSFSFGGSHTRKSHPSFEGCWTIAPKSAIMKGLDGQQVSCGDALRVIIRMNLAKSNFALDRETPLGSRGGQGRWRSIDRRPRWGPGEDKVVGVLSIGDPQGSRGGQGRWRSIDRRPRWGPGEDKVVGVLSTGDPAGVQGRTRSLAFYR